MPIRPENRARYPKNWKAISVRIRVERAEGRCECTGECGAVEHDGRCDAWNGARHPITDSIVVLTVAHLDHTPENCDDANLKAMCQRCHNRYDAPMRRAGMARRKREALDMRELPFDDNAANAIPERKPTDEVALAMSRFGLDRDLATSALRRWRARYTVLPNGCWQWHGVINSGGYGEFKIRRKAWMLHRFSYVLLRGPIPVFLCIDHLCRNRACCNPEHLELVTPGENVRRGLSGKYQVRKSHCSRGHAFTPDNALWAKSTKKRKCKTCQRNRDREAKRAMRQKLRAA